MSPHYDPADDGPETASDLMDNHSKALKTFLREMTSVYAEDNQMKNVIFGGRAAADADGEFIMIDPSFPDRVSADVQGPQVLRVLDDTVSHEVAHLNWSETDSKEAFVEEYDGWGMVPGAIINILEDAYIDRKRVEKWYGLRSKMAYSTWLAMQDDDVQAPVDATMQDDNVPDVKAYIDALCQLSCAGYVKYEDRIPPAVAEFLVDAEPLLKRARTQDDASERYNLAHAAMAVLQQHVDVPDAHDKGILPEGVKPSDVPQAPGPSGGDASEAAQAGPDDAETQEAVDDIIDQMEQEGAEVDRDAGEVKMEAHDVTRDKHDPEVVKRVKTYTDGYEPTDLRVVNDD